MKQAKALRNHNTGRGCAAAAALLFFIFAMELTAFAAESGGAALAAKTTNMSIAYGITTALSLFLFVGYCALVRQKNIWLRMTYGSVVIVNLGYLALSVSKTLEEALLANRISYFGSVFLPLGMLMAILDICRIRYRKRLLGLLFWIGVGVFLVAASPGYLDCYYKEATLVFVNGMARLDKEYGPLHVIYLVYLLAYFGAMIGAVLTSIMGKKTVSCKHAALLLAVVFLNAAIWLVEQLIYSDFEFLSVSYIASGLLLLMLYGMMQDYGIWPGLPETGPLQAASGGAKKGVAVPAAEEESAEGSAAAGAASGREGAAALPDERIAQIMAGWPAVSMLTAREAEVLRALLENKKRKDIAADLNVTEHTVKKHTANIFSKLEVSSRSELTAKADRETDVPN